jgi:uncharacterized circularly permuted ATP-grasp superfamily protein
MLVPLLKELDEHILQDPALVPALFDRLTARQRELGLVFGDRPTCPFLRPHIISRSQYDEVARAAQTVAAAVENLVAHALVDDELLATLGLTERELQMARIDPGYSRLCVSSRLDAYLSDDGFQFLEYNAETPAGVGDQLQLEKVLFEFEYMKALLDSHAHWRPEPHKRLLSALLDAYRDWSDKEERPHIAIVDWKGVPTESEFLILKEYFAVEGYQTVIADPRDLTYSGGRLRFGDFPNYAELFTPHEIETFHRHVPWTRRLAPGRTTFENAERDLLDVLRVERERLVLKPNDDYGGHGVVIGWETSKDDWEQAISLALKRPYVVQERVPLRKTAIPSFAGVVQMEEMFIDFNPFLFNNEVEGALIRLSSSSLLNVTSGGGQTALLVLEGM